MVIRVATAVVVFIPDDEPEPARCERECLAWCDRERIGVFAVTSDPGSAIACVQAGDAEAILVAREDHLRHFAPDVQVVTGRPGRVPPRQRRTGRVDRQGGAGR
jgi:hypothetical protein